MPIFEYTALDAKGKNISGIIDSESSVIARQKLRSTKIFPVTIKEVKDSNNKKEPKGIAQYLSFFSRIKSSEITMMTRQLSTLVGAGFPLVTALDTLIPQTQSKPFQKVLSYIKDAIVEGTSFAGALNQYPNIFTPLYINMVKAGESSGTLEIVLEELAEINENQQALMSRIRSAMVYPILMLILGLLVLFFLMTFIVPNITAIFADMNQVLPTPTRVLIKLSDWLVSYWWILLVLFTGLIFALKAGKKTIKGRYAIDNMALSMPLIGQLIQKLSVARISRTLGSLLAHGVTMLAALEIVKNITNNVLLADTITSAAKDIGQGQGLGVSLGATGVFPHLAIQMIQVGEQSGELEAMLERIADVYEREAELTITSLTALLEPFMILFMGVVIGFIVLSICLPIFEMNQLVR